MSLTLDLTHLVSYRIGASSQIDAIAALSGTAAGMRHFVPGFLPCGECGACRRALVGACASPRRPLHAALSEGVASLDLPARFVVPIDEPTDAAILDPSVAALGGPIAFALFALASANVVPGDVTLWVGDGPLVDLGVLVSQTAGAQALGISSRTSPTSVRVETGAPGESHGNRKRVLFLVGNNEAAWALAKHLGEPGAVIVQVGDRSGAGHVPVMDLPTEARLICLSTYHPDFLPEAFAALRRDPNLAKAVVVHTVAAESNGSTGSLVRLTIESVSNTPPPA